MPAARQPLSARQIEVLRWVADWCPDGMMAGHTHKTTAVALQNRRLVAVSKRRGGWQAAVTDAGRYYLANGSYPDESAGSNPASEVKPRRGPARRSKPKATPPTPPDGGALPQQTGPADELIAALVAAGGRLVVQRDRTRRDGYDYERLIMAAQRHGKVLAGKRLIGKALPWPDIEIRLEEAIPGSDPELLPVQVPDKLRRPGYGPPWPPTARSGSSWRPAGRSTHHPQPRQRRSIHIGQHPPRGRIRGRIAEKVRLNRTAQPRRISDIGQQAGTRAPDHTPPVTADNDLRTRSGSLHLASAFRIRAIRSSTTQIFPDQKALPLS